MKKKMDSALDIDRDSNERKKPAFQRFKILSEVENILRKTEEWQITFQDNNGMQCLSDWLDPMPDGSYPNPKIVSTVLGCLDKLCIDQNEVDDSLQMLEATPNIEINLDTYSGNNPEALALLGPSYNSCRNIAKNIIDKINRARNKIQTVYDEDGRHDDGWRQLQR